jgi:uroporphyrinogen decarboxylase
VQTKPRTPKQNAITALERGIPDGLVPTFELEFQLTSELLCKEYHAGGVWNDAAGKERDLMFHENAELFVEVAETLDYSIIMDTKSPGEAGIIRNAKLIREMVGDKYLLIVHGDATYSIPDGDRMADFAVRMFERPDEMKRRADRMVDGAIERGKRLMDGGIDGFALCADYCFNTGPFLSPPMFAEFVTPFLARLIGAYREMGAYVIKHTDGNIMPILDQLVGCNPHAIHSIDTQAQDMDLGVIKRLVGDRVCLIGGVECGLLQTGTEEEIVENAKRALKEGMPGGGYIFSTSNVAFKGLPLERYLLILDVRQKYGCYAPDGSTVW